MRLTLPLKLGIISMVITLTGVLGLAFFTFQSSDELLQRQSLSRLADDVSREKEVLKNKLKTLGEDVRFLSESPATKGIVRSVRGGGFDVDENMTLNLWRLRLERLFKTVLTQRASYSQIRFIGKHDKGREIVRVERYEGKIITVAEDDLQEKGGRDYFKETLSLEPEGIYFSDITLNREKGRIVFPAEPVLRVGVPIFDATKTIFGIVVINVNFDLFVSSLYDAPKLIYYFMANERGDYLVHPDPEKRLAFERNLRMRYYDDFPGLNKQPTNPDNQKNRYRLEKIYPELETGVALDRLYFDEWGMPDRFFVLGAAARLTVFQEQSRVLRNKTIGLVGVITLVLTLVTVAFASNITRPIRWLTNVADRIAGGEDVDVPVNSRDEIGQLATSFRTMVSNLQTSRRDLMKLAGSLEDKVRELRKLSQAVEQSSSLVFITDTEGAIEYINKKFLETTGYSPKEVIGKNPRILKSEDTPSGVYENLWRTIKAGEIWRGEIKDRCKDGTFYWANVSISPIHDEAGKIIHFVAVHEDITKRKEAEAAMKSSAEQAEIANRSKTELLANMSHELRTPLNAIIGFSDTMRREIFGPLSNERYLEYANDINNSGAHLLELINDILDVSAIEAGELSLNEEKLDIAGVLDASIRLIAHRIEEGKIRLTTDFGENIPKLLADERRIKQIALNLLSNSAKFTEEGGEISVSVSMDGNGALAVVFADTGIGMDENEVAVAITKFGQVDGSLARKHEGTGLGLPLVQNLIEAHGGTLEMESEKGVGTTVTITFPVERVIV